MMIVAFLSLETSPVQQDGYDLPLRTDGNACRESRRVPKHVGIVYLVEIMSVFQRKPAEKAWARNVQLSVLKIGTTETVTFLWYEMDKLLYKMAWKSKNNTKKNQQSSNNSQDRVRSQAKSLSFTVSFIGFLVFTLIQDSRYSSPISITESSTCTPNSSSSPWLWPQRPGRSVPQSGEL